MPAWISERREVALFGLTLAALVVGFFHESLLGGKILGSGDVLLASSSFRAVAPPDYEPANRLLMDPTLQFEPWIEFNRRMIRSGRLPLWNTRAGCGAPHLANGQAAVFDPFNLVAYVGPIPTAFGGMAALRLWFAGLGMFLLARAWGLGRWGRWFAGLTWPGSGFLVAWLLYPVTNAAVWLPWVVLATWGVWDRPTLRRAALLALAVGGTLLGGHVQTSAHVLLAGGFYAVWLVGSDQVDRARRVGVWVVGITLGIALAAAEVVPLGAYLTRSPVWEDRERERVEPWRLVRPRLLEAACTALPGVYGSQRRGEPNLARALGVDNQNEASGGFAGLASLIWLAPFAWGARRERPAVRFLVVLGLLGAAGAARLPGVDNLLRAIPVLKVTDNRRLGLWVGFALALLGGVGMDQLASFRPDRRWRVWVGVWVVGALALLVGAIGVGRLGTTLRVRATTHYAEAAARTPGADPAEYHRRAERQVADTLRYVPRYLAVSAAEFLILAGLAVALARRRVGVAPARGALLALTLADLARFGLGLNPALDPSLDRPLTPLIAALQARVGDRGRIVGLGAELPPNALMRYGLSDARNYDSVELGRNLDWLAPLYDPAVLARTSRRDVTWERAASAEGRDRLREAGVMALVGASEPPPGLFDRVERFAGATVAWLDAEPLVTINGGTIHRALEDDGRWTIDATNPELEPAALVVRATFDPGWRAVIDGRAAVIEPRRGVFLAVAVPPGRHQIGFTYDPIEVRVGLLISLGAAITVVFALTGIRRFRSTRYLWSHGLDGPRPSG